MVEPLSGTAHAPTHLPHLMKGKSVVDNAIVQAEQFHNYSEFEVKTVLDVLENVSIPSDSPKPDHSMGVYIH